MFAQRQQKQNKTKQHTKKQRDKEREGYNSNQALSRLFTGRRQTDTLFNLMKKHSFILITFILK